MNDLGTYWDYMCHMSLRGCFSLRLYGQTAPIWPIRISSFSPGSGECQRDAVLQHEEYSEWNELRLEIYTTAVCVRTIAVKPIASKSER